MENYFESSYFRTFSIIIGFDAMDLIGYKRNNRVNKEEKKARKKHTFSITIENAWIISYSIIRFILGMVCFALASKEFVDNLLKLHK